MSKEELLKYLIAEIDLIMHDKDYRFENANGTWYSRESCRDLTNEEVFEELRTELRQFADLEAKLAEMQNEKDELISKYRYWKGECAELKEQLAKEQKHISRLKNMNKSHDEAVGRLTEENKQLKQQLAEKEIQRTHNYYQAVRDRETIRESKISFAVEQLEKVKAELVKLGQDYSLNWCGIKIYNFIDDQINELKEK